MRVSRRDRVLRVVGADHAVAPVEDLVPVLLGHAHHLGDHLERQLGGDVDDEVALAALGDVVDDRRARCSRMSLVELRRSCAA